MSFLSGCTLAALNFSAVFSVRPHQPWREGGWGAAAGSVRWRYSRDAATNCAVMQSDAVMHSVWVFYWCSTNNQHAKFRLRDAWRLSVLTAPWRDIGCPRNRRVRPAAGCLRSINRSWQLVTSLVSFDLRVLWEKIETDVILFSSFMRSTLWFTLD